MKNEYHNPSDERNIKHLKETIDLLRRENNRLRSENKVIVSLKDTIKKLQEEKIEMSQKIIDYESESLLYNASKDNKDDILLYNPKSPSKKMFNISLVKSSFSFNFYGKKNTNILKDGLKNKNEEIIILKNELVKKEEIISLLKAKNKKIEFKNEKCNNFSITTSGNNSKRNNSVMSNGKVMASNTGNSGNILNSNNTNTHNNNYNDINKYTSAFSWAASPSTNNNNKKRNVPFNNDIMYEETESHFSLEKNIYKEIQNILEEKRNFILNTLTYENFSFDILKPQKNKNTASNININSLEDIDKLIEIIKNRKQKVQKTKKSLEEKLS